MSKDIVQRLLTFVPVESGELYQVLFEAAAEIERLRAVLSDIDALACNVGRPDEAVDYWVTGYANAMQKVNALLHPGQARRG